jgi:type I restriction enzyme, S subunit
MGTGSTFVELSSEALGALLLPALPVTEQRRIADFLDDQVTRIDEAAQATTSALELLVRRHAGALERLLTGKDQSDLLPATWRPFEEVPSPWIETRLRSVPCDVQTGPFGSQLHSSDYVNDGWPVVNPANIKDHGIVAIEGVSVDDATRERLARHKLRVGDVVFGRRGELGRAGLVDEARQGWICGTGSLRVRLRGGVLSPEFLLRLLRTASIRHYFETQAVGSTMANLNTGILMAMPVLVPSLDSQDRLVSEARQIEQSHRELAARFRDQTRLLTERKRALITAAVTGEFDVSTASTRAAAAVTG